MTNKEKFAEMYVQSFKECYPHLPLEKADQLIAKALKVALENIRSVQIEGAAFKATFKKLGIKHTYKDAEEFLNG